MLKYFTNLDFFIINKYVDRKHSGMISFFYNSKIKKFLSVPINMEHANVVAKILNASFDDIITGVVDASYFIPVVVVIKDNEYQSIILGSSSLEMALKVRHKKSDLINAENATIILLDRSPLKINRNFQKIIVMKYAV